MKKLKTLPEMKGVIDRFRSSGQSVREFCRKERIGEHSLRYWIRKERSLINSGSIKPKDKHKPVGFEQIRVTQEILSGIEVQFPSGLKIILREITQESMISLLWEIDRKGRA
jgi:phage antirepressor YoqD-like protein